MSPIAGLLVGLLGTAAMLGLVGLATVLFSNWTDRKADESWERLERKVKARLRDYD